MIFTVAARQKKMKERKILMKVQQTFLIHNINEKNMQRLEGGKFCTAGSSAKQGVEQD